MFKEYRISDIGEVIGGGTPSTKNDEYWNGNIPWISPKDLTGYNSVYISYGENFITDKGLKSGTRLLPKDTVLFSSRAPIGYIALAANDICTNQGFKSIVCDHSKVNPLYLYYYLKSNINYIKLFGSGATFPEISGSSMKKIKINIFESIDYQKKVANSIYKYDELIEVNNKRIKLLEQAAEELYKEWFVRFRFPNYQSAEFENEKPNGWHFGDESNMKRPKGWEYTKFKKLGLFKRGKNITASEMVEGNIPVISAGIEPSGYHNKPNVYGKSLTISASGANAGFLKYNLKNIWAADCLYYQDDELLWYVYNTLKFLQPVISNMQCGAAQPHVYPKNISKLCIIIPPKSLIKKFCNTVTPFYNEIKQLNQKNEILIKQRDLLLPRLMSGKLSVETKTGSAPKVKKIISFDKFCSNMGMAARAKSISDEDLRAMYEAYIDDDATE